MQTEIIKMAIRSLLANKMRSFLSMLGIIIGVSTVIAVFAIGKGAQAMVDQQFKSLSANSLIIMTTRGRDAVGSSKLDIKDVPAILDQATHVKDASASVRGSVTAANPADKTSGSFSLLGTDVNFFGMSNLKIGRGALFTNDDLKAKSKVVVIGSKTAETLFDKADPINQNIIIAGRTMKVIGIMETVGASFGPFSLDEAIFAPYTLAKDSLLGDKAFLMMTVVIDDIANVKLATDEITQVLRKEHKLRASQDDDFQIRDAGSMVATAQNTAKMMTMLLLSIAAITLLVSGIGIMNVMFVTVAERTKEIGIAKAVGGKQHDILGQFLLESVILSMIGGLVGIFFGQVIIMVIAATGLMMPIQSFQGLSIGFLFSVFVGIFFGFYPAYKASQLDPVDALRSE